MKQHLVMLRNVTELVGNTKVARSFKKLEDALNFSIECVKQTTSDETIIEFAYESLKKNPGFSFDNEKDEIWELEIREVELEE